jgi:D-cysteine desulfhydrase family pyridoxal phosphate-dependent enzyme
MIPRVHLAHLPTPIDSAPRLASSLGLKNLFIKRDDLTGLAFGGNKARKLEFLVAEARNLKAKTLLTTGAIQSNHCRQTAAAAAKYGLNCTLVLVGKQPEKATANLLLDNLFGAKIIWVDSLKDRDNVLQESFEKAKFDGEQPYLVPYGGSSPVGVLGFVYAMKELIRQKVKPDWIIFATSSGGTQAGLVLGARLWKCGGRLLGISVDQVASELSAWVAGLATQASMKIGKHWIFSPEEILVNDDYCSAGYGVLTHKEQEAIHLFAQTEGLLLDPVYTGRGAAGFIDLARKGFFPRDDRIVFWHTGGQPALFADKYNCITD